MGRPKKELKRIKRKRARKAKERLRLYLKGEVSFESLPKASKRLWKKRKRQELKPS